MMFLILLKGMRFLSEEEGESLHNAFNMENRQLVSVRNESERIHLSMKRHALRSQCNKSLILASKRLCKCSAQGLKSNRIFLKDGQTMCPECKRQADELRI